MCYLLKAFCLFQVREGDFFGAFGLSVDNKMGDDLVFSCSSSGEVTPYWNQGHSPNSSVEGVEVGESSKLTTDGFTSCEFTVDEKMVVTPPGEDIGRVFDLKNTKYYLLVATGYVLTKKKRRLARL